jgi:flagellar biosynthesis/type III secretory pathway chaperone
MILPSLEKLFHRKIMLYNDLLHCLKKERESLVHIDLDNLWAVSKEKELICSSLESVRQEILSVVTDPNMVPRIFHLKQIVELIPSEHRTTFQRLNRTIINLKCEIDLLRKENMSLIDDSLHFLDEMVSILTGKMNPKSMYNEKCHLSRSTASLLLSREA